MGGMLCASTRRTDRLTMQKKFCSIAYGSTKARPTFELVARGADGGLVKMTAEAPSEKERERWIQVLSRPLAADWQAFVEVGAVYEEPCAPLAASGDLYQMTVFDSTHRPVCLDRFRSRVLLVAAVALGRDDGDTHLLALQALHTRYHPHTTSCHQGPSCILNSECEKPY